MTELLDHAIEKVRCLPDDKQDKVALAMLELEAKLKPRPGVRREAAVPDVVGMDISEAREKIKLAEWFVIAGEHPEIPGTNTRVRALNRKEIEVQSSSEPSGKVISQKPKAGKRVPMGTEVELTIAQ
jgi:beta-lactam-binding protein with PASTA domain